MLCVYCIYIYHVNKFEARLLFLYLPLKQDAREAMRVVFFCTYKTYLYAQKKGFLMNIFKYCLKNYIKLNEFANCNSANNYDV